MGKFNRPLSKRQLSHRQAKQMNKPGGKMQPRGTPPNEHILPNKPGFILMDNPDVKLAQRLGIKPQRLPDLRCPECGSSVMGNMGLKRCPQCGYEGEPVDINDKKEVVKPEEITVKNTKWNTPEKE